MDHDLKLHNAIDTCSPFGLVDAVDTPLLQRKGDEHLFSQVLYEQLHQALEQATPTSLPALETQEPPANAVSFGYQLRRWRLRQGYTRAVLAAKVGIDPLTCLALEQNLALPAVLSLQQLTSLYALITDQENTYSL